MGPRKRSRPNPKVEDPVHATQDTQGVQAAAVSHVHGSTSHAPGPQELGGKTPKVAESDAASIKVCMPLGEPCRQLLMQASLAQMPPGTLLAPGLGYRRPRPQRRLLGRVF